MRTLPFLILLAAFACKSGATASSSPAASATPSVATPAYIPSECAYQPLATVPAATEQAPSSVIAPKNPDISANVQKLVFNAIVKKVSQVYVDPNFNGHDWAAITAKYKAKVDAGLSTSEFYAQMQAMLDELGDAQSHLQSPADVALHTARVIGSNAVVGIGVLILPMVSKNRIALIEVFPESPADRAGLKTHDSILAVDGLALVQNSEVQAQLISGPECSAAVLTVQSPGQAPREITLVRTRIQTPLIVQEAMLPTLDGSRVAYLSLPTFLDETVPGQVEYALDKFGALDGLILDLRMNEGGSTDVLLRVLADFASSNLGRFVGRSNSYSLSVAAHAIHNSQTVPLVVLVGGDTIGYGEIFAGVLQDSGRAQIVGQPTAGKVEGQQGYSLGDGSQLWIAQETFISAHSKANWEQTGIIPDVLAYADWDTFTFETDPAIAAALKLLGH